jgi:hypothetical protein
MATVTIQGVLMGANPKTTKFEGTEKTSIYIDVYQPDSTNTDKMVQIKTDDLSLLSVFNKDYSQGSPFTCVANVNAYKNKAYYKLVSIA